MYNLDDIGSTYLSLPPNLQDVENECFAYALDKQIKKFHELAKSLTIWSNLDEVDPKYYDYLALCIRAPYYRSEYENEMKLSLLKTSLEMNRYAGTRSAIDKLLDTIFERAEFKPWYDYGGEPYHFKPLIYDVLTEDAATVFSRVIKKVKSARSIMDAIEIGRQIFETIYVGVCTGASYKAETIIETHSFESDTEMELHAGAAMNPIYKAEKIV